MYIPGVNAAAALLLLLTLHSAAEIVVGLQDHVDVVINLGVQIYNI